MKDDLKGISHVEGNLIRVLDSSQVPNLSHGFHLGTASNAFNENRGRWQNESLTV